MRNFIFSLGLTLLLATASSAQTKGLRVVPIRDASGKQVGLYKGSHALVIGVSQYMAGWPKLPSVIGETEEIEAALKANGFSVRRVLDPDKETLKREFEQFIDRYGYDKDNRLLVFFSGHGYSRSKGAKGYLVPTDAPDPRKDEKGFLRKALPMSQVLAWCRQMEAKHALFLFDSCFSGTIFKTKALPKTPPHISAITSRPVRQFITAGDSGEEVPAKSVFTSCFLRALRGDGDLSKDGYLTGSELGMYLRDKVMHYRTGQTPQYGKMRDPDLDEGDFVFVLGKGHGTSLPTAQPLRAADTNSEQFWDALTLASEDLPAGFSFRDKSPGKEPGPWQLMDQNPGFVDISKMKGMAQKAAARDPDLAQHPILKAKRWYVGLFSKRDDGVYVGYNVIGYESEADAVRFLRMGHVAEDGEEGGFGSHRHKNFVIFFIAQDTKHHGVSARNHPEIKKWCDRTMELVKAKLRDAQNQ